MAADPQTRSPMRLAEAGPWWDQPPHAHPEEPEADLAELEARLDDLGGLRVTLQAKAREELAAEHLPLTRSTVVTRAVQIHNRDGGDHAA